MIPTYIITGANGHVAQTVIHKLKNTNSEIRGLILPSEYNVDTDNVKYYKGDITRPYTMQDIFSGIDGPSTVVIHAAGIITIGDEITTALSMWSGPATSSMRAGNMESADWCT